MKHTFEEWKTGHEGLGGFARTAIGPEDSHSKCRRCNVVVKIATGQTTKKFWVGGRWVTKTPPCGEPR